GELMEDTLENIEAVEEELLKREDIDIIQLSVTDSGDPMAAMMGGGGDGALMFLIFDPEMENFPEAKEEIEEYVFNIGQSGEWKSQDFSSMAMATDELTYTFYSEDLDKLNGSVEMVEEVMNDNDRLEDVSSSAEDAYVEHTFKVEQDELLQYGLTAGQIVMLLSPSTTQEVITTVEKDGETLDVIVQQEETEQPKSIDELLETEIPTTLDTTMPLSELVTVEEGTTFNTLAR